MSDELKIPDQGVQTDDFVLLLVKMGFNMEQAQESAAALAKTWLTMLLTSKAPNRLQVSFAMDEKYREAGIGKKGFYVELRWWDGKPSVHQADVIHKTISRLETIAAAAQEPIKQIAKTALCELEEVFPRAPPENQPGPVEGSDPPDAGENR